MTIRQIIEQSDFKTGIIDANFTGQGNTALYQHGVKSMENFEVKLEGTLTRRPGMEILKKLDGDYLDHLDDIRILSCQWGKTTGTIMTVIPAYPKIGNGLPKVGYINIFNQGGGESSWVRHQWSPDMVKNIRVTDTALGSLLCQDGDDPLLLSFIPNKDSDGYKFDPSHFLFEQDSNGVTTMPFEVFEGGFMSVTPTGDTILVKTTRDVFVGTGIFAKHTGVQFKVFGGVIRITSVIDKRNAHAIILRAAQYWKNSTTKDSFTEQAFSQVRGFPRVGITYQGRMVFAGTKSLPAKLWMSKLGNFYNFDLGEGGDSDAIAFSINADQAEEVQWLVAGRYLEIYTNLAEWSCPLDVLTPTSVSLVRQSRYGMSNQAATPPVNVEGATIFLGKDNQTLHQTEWSDLNKGYEHHIINGQAQTLTADIVALHYDLQKKLLYGLKGDGSLAVMTYYREAQVFAWGKMTTSNHKIMGIAYGRNDVADAAFVEQPYFLVQRDKGLYVETLNNKFIADGIEKKSAIANRNTEITLESFCGGKKIVFYQDGVIKKIMTAPVATSPTANITMLLPAEIELNKDFHVGLVFNSMLQPLHRFSGPGGGTGFSAMKLARLSLLVKDTPVLCWQRGDGENFVGDIIDHVFDTTTIIDPPKDTPPNLVPYTGWASFAIPGWLQKVSSPLWQIHYQNPYPLTLLSAKEEYLLSTISNQPTNQR